MTKSLQEEKLFVIKKNNTRIYIYMSLVNKHNDQFIQPRIDNRKGVVCDGQSGGGYGATSDSLAASANSNLGKGHASPVTYNHCDKQSGGGHDYDADFGNPLSYGYTQKGAAIAGQLRGSYAPINVNPPQTQCGAGKRRKKSRKKRKRRRKKKTRKSRKRKRTKRRRKYRRKSKGKRGGCGKCNRFKRRKTRTRKLRGGAYAQYGSNIADTPSYSTSNASSLPWATGPGSFKRQINCQDNYNHYKK